MGWLAILLGIVLLGALLYWLLVLTEGTYLGPRVVALTYDWFASRYDRVKGVQYAAEELYIGLPLAERLRGIEHPAVLDIATGTGRVPLALERSGTFDGLLVAGDRSQGMLKEAQQATAALQQVTLLRLDAIDLPVRAEAFDAITCLEALEFVPDARRALTEMLRALKPGGVVLLSNRVGREATLFVRRMSRRGSLEKALSELGFVQVHSQPWQVYYDLVWAEKPAGVNIAKQDIVAQVLLDGRLG